MLFPCIYMLHLVLCFVVVTKVQKQATDPLVITHRKQ